MVPVLQCSLLPAPRNLRTLKLHQSKETRIIYSISYSRICKWELVNRLLWFWIASTCIAKRCLAPKDRTFVLCLTATRMIAKDVNVNIDSRWELPGKINCMDMLQKYRASQLYKAEQVLRSKVNCMDNMLETPAIVDWSIKVLLQWRRATTCTAAAVCNCLHRSSCGVARRWRQDLFA